MKWHRKFLRITSAVLLALVVFASGTRPVLGNGAQDSSQSSQQSLKDRLQELEELQKQQRALIDQCNANIQAGKDVAAAAQQRKAALEAERLLIEQQIELKIQEIDLKAQQIEQKAQEITDKQHEYDENDRLYQERLVAIYKMNDSNLLSSFLAVESFADFLDVVKNMRVLSQHDSDLLAQLTAQRNALEAAKVELEGMLAALETERAGLNQKWDEYNANIAAEGAVISNALAQVAANEQDKAEALAAIEAYQEEMEGIWRSLKSVGGQYVGGALQWPVPSHNGKQYISSWYGWRTLYGKANFHSGVDIARGPTASIDGADIVAANTGTVVMVVTNSNTGYGKYLIIDHGGGVKTLYAHCSAIYVSVNDFVYRGDVIAAVGNTGRSTGPHLHFELRLNNTEKTDPFPYLNGSKELS